MPMLHLRFKFDLFNLTLLVVFLYNLMIFRHELTFLGHRVYWSPKTKSAATNRPAK